MNGSVIFRCPRCRVALAPRMAFDVEHPTDFTVGGEDLKGPCIDPADGSVLPQHHAVRAEVTTYGPAPTITPGWTFTL